MLQLGPEFFELLNAKQQVGNQQPAIYGKGGLSTLDIQLIEAKLGFLVPPDFALLLQNVRDPDGVLFPWSRFTKPKYDESIAWILKGIEFDIRENSLWLKRWGARPAALSDALDIARSDFATWPKLLPVSGHRFLAAEPHRADNPVFSINQTDIIYYGANLAHYLIHEFVDHSDGSYVRHTHDQEIQRVEIWSDFAERRVDFYTKAKLSEAKARQIAAAMRARANEKPRPLIEIEMKADGNIFVGGEATISIAALESKLRELTVQKPPPDLRVRPDESISRESLQACQTLLERLGFSTILLFELHGNEVFRFAVPFGASSKACTTFRATRRPLPSSRDARARPQAMQRSNSA